MSLVVPPSTLDIVIPQGATWSQTLTWEHGPSEEDTDPVDLTLASARAQFRARHGATTALLALTSDPGGGITLGGLAGTIALDASATQTAAMPAGSAVWDLEIVWPDGAVCRLVQGKATITPEVTR